MDYHDFDLWIDRGADGGLVLRSRCETHGEYRGVSAPDVAALQRDERALTEGTGDGRLPVELGSRLYSYVFGEQGGSIGWHFGQCWGLAQRGGRQGVRLRLRIEAPDVAAIPWEYLYSRHLESFLAVSVRTPVVRYLELSRPLGLLEAPLPLRMLLLIPERSGLDAGVERAQLLSALRDLRREVTVTVLDRQVTYERIERALAEAEYHLVHFIGHGDFESDRAVLELNGQEEGSVVRVDHVQFGNLLFNHVTLKLVVLNSCKGAEVSPSKPFVGMAPELVRRGVPAVVAMQYEIFDDEAVRFASTFYHHLFRGAEKGRVEVAMSHARHALATSFPDTKAVGTPVLYTHAREGVLFNLLTGNAIRDVPYSPAAVSTAKAVLKTHTHNIAMLEGSGETESDRPPSDPQVAELIRQERAAKTRLERRLTFRHASVATAFGMALGTFFLSWIIGFQKLPQRLRLESYAVWLTDIFDRHASDGTVALVSIDGVTEEIVARKCCDSRWRVEHAAVVRNLRRAGAKVVAFTMALTEPSPHDAELVRAIREATDSGMTVLVGARELAGGRPRVAEPFTPLVGVGLECLGGPAWHSAKAISLVTAGGTAGAPRRVPSLALLAVAAYRGARIDGVDVPGRQVLLSRGSRRDSVGFAEASITTASEPECPGITAGDTLADMIIEYAPLRELQDPARRFAYHDILRAGANALPDLRGRLVLVGRDDPARRFAVQRGLDAEQRYATELEMDAVSTIIRGVVIRPVGGVGQFAVILAMAALGAAAASATLPAGTKGRIALLLGVLLLYLAGASYLYATRHLLLNTVYHVAALVVTFAAVRTVKRTWFP